MGLSKQPVTRQTERFTESGGFVSGADLTFCNNSGPPSVVVERTALPMLIWREQKAALLMDAKMNVYIFGISQATKLLA